MWNNVVRAACSLALFTVLAEATANQPNFYARREYGDNKGCAGERPFQIADINADGVPDIVCAEGQVMLGKGDGTFKLSQENLDLQGNDLAVLDLNGDGKLDLILLNATINGSFQYGFNIALGNGDGTFQQSVFYPIADPGKTFPTFLATADFNGDGNVDAVTVGTAGIWILFGKGGGQFETPLLLPRSDVGSKDLLAVDLNQDGRADLIVSTNAGLAVLFGNGDGTFATPVLYSLPGNGSPYLAVGDINGDGFPDVIAVPFLDHSGVDILAGGPGGTLAAPYIVSLAGSGKIAIGDLNGDGIPDLVSADVEVAYGLGGGRFAPPLFFPIASALANEIPFVAVAQLRKDQLPDIVVTDTFLVLTVLTNRGNGSFIEGVGSAVPGAMSACTVQADFNNDGIPDIAFVENADTLLVMLGTGDAKAPFRQGPATPIPKGSAHSSTCPSVNAADINGDGIPDLLIGIPSPRVVSVNQILLPLFGVGDGSFRVGKEIYFGVFGYVYLVDVNGDGKVDFVSTSKNLLGLGNGDGTFQKPVPFLPNLTPDTLQTGISSLSWGDLNGDGKLDFVAPDGVHGLTYLLLSTPSGTSIGAMIEDPAISDAYLVGIGDLNGDGSSDLVLGSTLNTPAIYLNDGTGNFTFAKTLHVPGLNGAAPFVQDLNGDGIPDLLFSASGDVAIFTNEGNLAFTHPQYFGTPPSYVGLFLSNQQGQAPGSGKPDIVLPDTSGKIVTLLNLTK